jgi:3-hydroxyisobutyrate dehydrogenase-like beta-hydroxyacid dehydrogenase
MSESPDDTDPKKTFENGPTVGVVGVGTMGAPIAERIADDFDTVAVDLDPERLESVADAGVAAADDPRDLARRSDIVFLSLPSSKAVEAVTLGDDGVLAGLSTGDVLVDTGTTHPETSETIADACDERGVEFLDIPVSGGPRNAKTGELAAMAGGDAAVLELITPVLECFSETIYHVGGRGTGIAMKLANNYMLAVNSAVVCEALVMARRAGIDDETFLEVASNSSGDSYALRRNVGQFVIPGAYDDPDADLPILTKDVTLAEELGRDLGVPLLVGGETSSVYRLAEDRGLGEYDFAALLALYDPDEDVDG